MRLAIDRIGGMRGARRARFRRSKRRTSRISVASGNQVIAEDRTGNAVEYLICSIAKLELTSYSGTAVINCL